MTLLKQVIYVSTSFGYVEKSVQQDFFINKQTDPPPDWNINVTVKSIVLTNKYAHVGNLFQQIRIFKLSRNINETKISSSFTTFHDDQTINVACCVLTRQNVDDA
ncbi:hypothetical protein DPMN_038078 [Dreissena polymorpha]|uniref:Uncharacterized protein n=1 Tax=Dreissena polymorpha TaxID=45954 RepID=A0A9D4MER7_DREPO|nr:hypothetical protein DPMN_038078 [Dreissena polymorpha]